MGERGQGHMDVADPGDRLLAVSAAPVQFLVADLFPQRPQLVGHDRAGDDLGRDALDDAPRLEDVPGLLDGRLRDEGAAILLQIDQVFEGEPLKGGPHEEPLGGEGFGDRLLGKLGARRQIARRNRGPDALANGALDIVGAHSRPQMALRLDDFSGRFAQCAIFKLPVA